MYITGFLINIQSSCIGMDWSRKLQSSLINIIARGLCDNHTSQAASWLLGTMPYRHTTCETDPLSN